jgi:hypothetical protein
MYKMGSFRKIYQKTGKNRISGKTPLFSTKISPKIVKIG